MADRLPEGTPAPSEPVSWVPRKPEMLGFTPAEAFPVSVLLVTEMFERDWTRSEVARRMGGDFLVNSAVLDFIVLDVGGDMLLGEDVATQLETAFGISAEMWLRTDEAYRSWSASGGPAPSEAAPTESDMMARRNVLDALIFAAVQGFIPNGTSGALERLEQFEEAVLRGRAPGGETAPKADDNRPWPDVPLGEPPAEDGAPGIPAMMAVYFPKAWPDDPKHWLNSPEYQWFKDAYAYASTQTMAIRGLSEMHPAELCYVYLALQRGDARVSPRTEPPE